LILIERNTEGKTTPYRRVGGDKTNETEERRGKNGCAKVGSRKRRVERKRGKPPKGLYALLQEMRRPC